MDFAFFRIGTQVVTTPIIPDGPRAADACRCSHPHWDDASPSDSSDLHPDGIMQRCRECSSIRFRFDELSLRGIECIQTNEDGYNAFVSSLQKCMLLEVSDGI